MSFNGGGQVSSLFNTGGTIRVAGGILTNLSTFGNAGTLALAGGAYQATVQFTNTGWLVGVGTMNTPVALVNRGTIAANLGNTNTALVVNSDLLNLSNGVVRADSSALLVTGVFTNNGTLQFISSVGTYNQTVVNNGAWSSSGGSSVFSNNFVITTNGYVSAAGGKYVFTADLLNQSTNNLHWDTLGVTVGIGTVSNGVKFLFSGTDVTQTQTFASAGLRLTGGFEGSPLNLTSGVQNTVGYAEGYSNNFAVGQLWLTNTTLVLEQSPGLVATNGALFVNDLFLFGGSHLVINNDMTVYFVNSNAWTLADITLLGNAQIHQLTGLGTELVIPEPNVLLMWLCGALTVWAARRRNRLKIG